MIENWKSAWRWFSVQLASLLIVLPWAWAQLPEDIKAMIPPEWHGVIVSLMGAAIVLGRMIKQEKKQP